MGAGAQGVFPPWAHVEPVSPPTYLCGKNKVTHSVLLQEPSIGAFGKMRRNRLAPRCRWVRHNISSAAMTLGPRRASCEFSGSRRRGSPGLSPTHSPVAGPAAPRSASQVLLPGQPAKSLPQPIKSSGGKQEAPVPLSPQSPIPAATAVPLCFRVRSPCARGTYAVPLSRAVGDVARRPLSPPPVQRWLSWSSRLPQGGESEASGQEDLRLTTRPARGAQHLWLFTSHRLGTITLLDSTCFVVLFSSLFLFSFLILVQLLTCCAETITKISKFLRDRGLAEKRGGMRQSRRASEAAASASPPGRRGDRGEPLPAWEREQK